MSTTLAVISPLLDALGRVPFVAGVLTKGTLLVLIAACQRAFSAARLRRRATWCGVSRSAACSSCR
jgi:hypothetical protein